MITVKRLKYISKHWKLGIHLVCRTNRFGVNNEWWSQFDSLFGAETWRGHLSVRHNWKLMKHRAKVCYFVGAEEYELLFGEPQDK